MAPKRTVAALECTRVHSGCPGSTTSLVLNLLPEPRPSAAIVSHDINPRDLDLPCTHVVDALLLATSTGQLALSGRHRLICAWPRVFHQTERRVPRFPCRSPQIISAAAAMAMSPLPPPPVPDASPSSLCMPAREEVSAPLLALVQLASRLESAYLRALIGLVSVGRNRVHRVIRVSFILLTRLCCKAWRIPVARRHASQLLLRKRENARPGCNEHLVIHNGTVN